MLRFVFYSSILLDEGVFMSQLGKCSCGEILVKTMGTDKITKKEYEIEICPNCNTPNKMLPEQIMKKTIQRDKFGFEKLEK